MKFSQKICYFITQYPKNMDLSYPNTFYVNLIYIPQHKDLIKNIILNRQKPNFDPKALAFGVLPADYMVNIDYKNNKWKSPVLGPFRMLEMHPFNSTLHYGVTCYEGLKAYKN
jgi:hypothetical protein